jgi:hypothetical protein
MKINPSEPPQPGDPSIRDTLGVGDGDSIRQLLAEIRDGQREMLQLQREQGEIARDLMQRQQQFGKFRFVWMLLPFAFMVPWIFLSFARFRALPPIPVRPAPRAAPLPNPIPNLRPRPAP